MRNFFKDVFMDGSKPSWSRIFATLFVIVPLGWVTFLVYINHQMPGLSEVTLLITGGITSTYGVNKFTTPSIVKAIDQTQPQQPSPQ